MTGDFEGSLCFQAKYRNQFNSIIGSSAYNAGVASLDYKFESQSLRKINIGFYSLFDRAGQTKLTTRTYNITSSIVQRLGPEGEPHHDIGIGFEFGLGNRSLDGKELRWPDSTAIENVNLKTTYLNMSTGVVWKYHSNNHFSFHLGATLHNINQPNVSFLSDNSSLFHRYNVHGIIEVPIAENISLEPSFLFAKQGPHEQLLFGLGSKFYLNSDEAKSFKVGLYTKTTGGVRGTSLGVYVFSATVELNSILMGFAIDRFVELNSNAFEFSFGYRLSRKSNRTIY